MGSPPRGTRGFYRNRPLNRYSPTNPSAAAYSAEQARCLRTALEVPTGVIVVAGFIVCRMLLDIARVATISRRDKFTVTYLPLSRPSTQTPFRRLIPPAAAPYDAIAMLLANRMAQTALDRRSGPERHARPPQGWLQSRRVGATSALHHALT